MLPDWMLREIPWHWQWIGLAATVLGAFLSLASFVAAWVSASRAKQARDNAERAWMVARRFSRLSQLVELLADMQELQTTIAFSKSPRMVAMKCDRLRGRVSRFRAECERDLTASQLEDLDRARTQLDIMSEASTDGSKKPNFNQLQIAFGSANEAIGRVAGSHSQQISENANVAI